jgi:hypothetical protein
MKDAFFKSEGFDPAATETNGAEIAAGIIDEVDLG